MPASRPRKAFHYNTMSFTYYFLCVYTAQPMDGYTCMYLLYICMWYTHYRNVDIWHYNINFQQNHPSKYFYANLHK